MLPTTNIAEDPAPSKGLYPDLSKEFNLVPTGSKEGIDKVDVKANQGKRDPKDEKIKIALRPRTVRRTTSAKTICLLM